MQKFYHSPLHPALLIIGFYYASKNVLSHLKIWLTQTSKCYKIRLTEYLQNINEVFIKIMDRKIIKEIISKCDHTNLSVTASENDIKKLCDEASLFGAASVCIPPCYVKATKRYIKSDLSICTVIGFPNGYSSTAAKVFETSDAIENGADEIDTVINIGYAASGKISDCQKEILAIRKACEGKILKVIIECCYLNKAEKISLCHMLNSTGADYIKTSTGFGTSGATLEDVKLFSEHCLLKIKAAGGIRTFEQAEAFIKAGAERIGSSALIRKAVEIYDRQL